MPNKKYTVDLAWDEESWTWTATSDDIPGLVLEGGSADALMERVRYTAPEIMRLNNVDSENCIVHFRLNRDATVFA